MSKEYDMFMSKYRAPLGSPVKINEWCGDLDECKALADEQEIPMLAVWTAYDCAHCQIFERPLMSELFDSWRKTCGLILCFTGELDPKGVRQATDESGKYYQFCKRPNMITTYPFCRLYWHADKGRTTIIDFSVCGDVLDKQQGISGGTYNAAAKNIIDYLTTTFRDYPFIGKGGDPYASSKAQTYPSSGITYNGSGYDETVAMSGKICGGGYVERVLHGGTVKQDMRDGTSQLDQLDVLTSWYPTAVSADYLRKSGQTVSGYRPITYLWSYFDKKIEQDQDVKKYDDFWQYATSNEMSFKANLSNTYSQMTFSYNTSTPDSGQWKPNTLKTYNFFKTNAGITGSSGYCVYGQFENGKKFAKQMPWPEKPENFFPELRGIISEYDLQYAKNRKDAQFSTGVFYDGHAAQDHYIDFKHLISWCTSTGTPLLVAYSQTECSNCNKWYPQLIQHIETNAELRTYMQNKDYVFALVYGNESTMCQNSSTFAYGPKSSSSIKRTKNYEDQKAFCDFLNSSLPLSYKKDTSFPFIVAFCPSEGVCVRYNMNKTPYPGTKGYSYDKFNTIDPIEWMKSFKLDGKAGPIPQPDPVPPPQPEDKEYDKDKNEIEGRKDIMTAENPERALLKKTMSQHIVSGSPDKLAFGRLYAFDRALVDRCLQDGAPFAIIYGDLKTSQKTKQFWRQFIMKDAQKTIKTAFSEYCMLFFLDRDADFQSRDAEYVRSKTNSGALAGEFVHVCMFYGEKTASSALSKYDADTFANTIRRLGDSLDAGSFPNKEKYVVKYEPYDELSAGGEETQLPSTEYGYRIWWDIKNIRRETMPEHES